MGNKIIYGNRVFEHAQIKSGNYHMARSLLSDSLEIDTLEFDAVSQDTSLAAFTRNTPLTYYYNGRQQGVFYVQKIKRAAKDLYHFTATSTIGLLDERKHYGGIYNGQTLSALVDDICGSLPHLIKTNLRDIKLYGYLPIATCRENLSQVLFAVGATVRTDIYGRLCVNGLWDGIADEINENRVFEGGNVEYIVPATRVSVTEHRYLTGGEQTTLFEGDTYDGDMITFDEPYYELAATGFAILQSGANYAVVGAGKGTLTGRKYLHNTRDIIKQTGVGDAENIVNVSDATLVSLVNADAVAERLAAYYSKTEIVENDIVFEGGQAGDVIQTIHPYSGAVRGCVESIDITLSGMLRGTEKSLINYFPLGIGQMEYLDFSEIISASNQWMVPQNVTTLRVVLIGGGDGGTSGGSGSRGTVGAEKVEGNARYAEGGKGGAGGMAGFAGSGGAIVEFSLKVVPGAVITFSIGTGGGSGLKGGETLCMYGGASYSSALGQASTNGYTDILTGQVFARRGTNGVKGGKGGDGGGSYAEKDLAQPGKSGENIGANPGGSGGQPEGEYEAEGWAGSDGVSGGGGSGAANMTAGRNGYNGRVEWDRDKPWNVSEMWAGSGAAGVTPPPGADGANFGDGGSGGSGGSGGGGAGGWVRFDAIIHPGSAGGYASGSRGGMGKGGCAIIYYHATQVAQNAEWRGADGRGFRLNDQRKFVV